MKISEFKPRVLEFELKCPKDESIHDAVAIVECAKEIRVSHLSCHKSGGCDVCAQCSWKAMQILESDPDMEDGPIQPAL